MGSEGFGYWFAPFCAVKGLADRLITFGFSEPQETHIFHCFNIITIEGLLEVIDDAVESNECNNALTTLTP